MTLFENTAAQILHFYTQFYRIQVQLRLREVFKSSAGIRIFEVQGQKSLKGHQLYAGGNLSTTRQTS